jgi:dTDP-4-dehydrorhamnose reductase
MRPASTATIRDLEDLEDRLSEPTADLIETFRRVEGDILILGVSGKMGPTLARMARRAADAARTPRRILGVARFNDEPARARLADAGVTTIRCDLLKDGALERLPDAPNVVYLAGMKFGASESAARTWAVNTFLPGLCARRFAKSRIVALSTGNVYGLVPVDGRGSVEIDAPNPAGEYAMSCVGRERILEYVSRASHVPMAILRLNYACELRYGVLVDLAEKVREGRPVDLAMGHFNVIWQADASAITLGALGYASSPPLILNVAGPEQLGVRATCEELARRLKTRAIFQGTESTDALLSDGSLGHSLFGPPRVPASDLVGWVADWVSRGGATLAKPTCFSSRDGRF